MFVRNHGCVPPHRLLHVQGIVGSMPWNAMVFLTLYLQLLGMGDFAASLLMALLLAGSAFGGLLGGWIGDRAAVRFPRTGRVAVAQFSVAIGVPLSVLLLKGLPLRGGAGPVALYAAVLLLHGLLSSWCAPACNNPVFAEIVPVELRNMVSSVHMTTECAHDDMRKACWVKAGAQQGYTSGRLP